MCNLLVKLLTKDAKLPVRSTPHAAGYDLFSSEEVTIDPRCHKLIPTGISIAIPEGTYGRIASRSGLTLKHGLNVGAGVIDMDYRGPVGVILFNHSDLPYAVQKNERIAQLILEKIATPEVIQVDDLDSTTRGVGGFGSTGKH